MRNRHTGKLNAYKQHILTKGRQFTDSRGIVYAGIINKRKDPFGRQYLTSQIVKAPASMQKVQERENINV
jgi:hypothetical protein